MSLRNATALTNQRYAHGVLSALDRLKAARVRRASQKLVDSMGDPKNKPYAGPAFDAAANYQRVQAYNPRVSNFHALKHDYSWGYGGGGGHPDVARHYMSVNPPLLPGGVRGRDIIRNGVVNPDGGVFRSYISPFRHMTPSTLPDIPVTPVK